MEQRYLGCMVLHGVGDSIGFRGQKWLLCTSANEIYSDLCNLGGVDKIVTDSDNWPVSDETVMHLSVAECLVENKNKLPGPDVYKKLINHYKNALNDMDGRLPSNITRSSIYSLSLDKPDGYRIPFNFQAIGCGPSSRSSCIGLRFPRPEQLEDLIQFSNESGRMTHHSPVAYLGGFVSALFTSFAIQNKKIENWGVEMLQTLPRVLEYVIKDGYYVKENEDAWPGFVNAWTSYLKTRNIDSLNSTPKFPDKYDIDDRERFYNSLAQDRLPGFMGFDAVIIAYDALLGCMGDWKELILRAAVHGGCNDATGSIAASWFGALYGFKGVSKSNFDKLEYFERLENCANGLYKISKQE